MTKKIDLEKEIKLINRRTEESLTIVIEHFKEIEERLDTLEKKVKQIKEKETWQRMKHIQIQMKYKN